MKTRVMLREKDMELGDEGRKDEERMRKKEKNYYTSMHVLMRVQ